MKAMSIMACLCVILFGLTGCGTANQQQAESSLTDTTTSMTTGEFETDPSVGSDEADSQSEASGSATSSNAATGAASTTGTGASSAAATARSTSQSSSSATQGSTTKSSTRATSKASSYIPKTTTRKATTTTKKATTTTAAGSNSQSDYAREVFEIVNRERKSAGLSALTFDTTLSANASVRAKEIVQKFDHTRPDGSKFSTAITISYRTAGENIAYGQRTPEEVMTGWMNSSGHKANILNSSFTKIGVGVYQSGGRYYWVQLFAG